jgi:hypothetical protein
MRSEQPKTQWNRNVKHFIAVYQDAAACWCCQLTGKTRCIHHSSRRRSITAFASGRSGGFFKLINAASSWPANILFGDVGMQATGPAWREKTCLTEFSGFPAYTPKNLIIEL